MPKIYFFIIGLAFGLGSLQAQDARFAQFYANPLHTNPAMAGVFEGELRFTANYRVLYSSILGTDAFRTVSAGIDIRRPAGRGNFVGIGAQLLQDVAGETNFSRTQGIISGSFQKILGSSGRGRRATSHYLVGGGSLGFGQRGFDIEKLWFSSQFFVDPGTSEAYIDRGLDGEPGFVGGNSGLYLDFSAGLLWYGVFGENKSMYAGAAIHHLNEPDISVIEGGTDQLYRKIVGHIGGEFPFGRSGFSLLPAAQVMSQGPAFSAMAGGNLRYTQREWREVALRIGAWAHFSNRLDATSADAVIISAVLELESLQFGVSYDLTLNELNLSNNGRGAFELSMIYVKPAKYRGRVDCPKF
ncbi:MAG: PorP/SprF family type IX secretion system membrane protein [Bacteroidota bacterium]